MQIFTFYPVYLKYFYAKNKFIQKLSYKEQIQCLLDDCFSVSHYIAPFLKQYGFETDIIIANFTTAQLKWAEEHNFSVEYNKKNISFEFNDISYPLIKKQIEAFQPDILYICDPIHFDSNFLRTLQYKPELIIGWRAAAIPSNIDWSLYDAILSNNIPILRDAPKLFGVKKTYYFFPGFPAYIYKNLKHEPKLYDLVFTGQITLEHKKRIYFLNELAKKSLSFNRLFNNLKIAFFISGLPDDLIPAGIAMYNYGAVWGMSMFKTLRQAKIALNIDIDFGTGGNMRLFEATGVGTFLLTQNHRLLSSYFKPGTEIESFHNIDEMFDKIAYYISNSNKREEIARNGNKKCLKYYSMENQVKTFLTILNDLRFACNK